MNDVTEYKCANCGTWIPKPLQGQPVTCKCGCQHMSAVREEQDTIKHASGEDWRSILDEHEPLDNDTLYAELALRFPYGHEQFIQLSIEEMELHSKKNYDYAYGGNPLGNFVRVASILSNYPGLKLTPAVIALIYAFKQLDSTLWQLSQGYEGQVEGMDKRLEDVHVYIKLARILLEEA